MKNIARQLQALRDQIHAMEQKYARLPGSVRLLAVSKARSVEEILATIGCNQHDLMAIENDTPDVFIVVVERLIPTERISAPFCDAS